MSALPVKIKIITVPENQTNWYPDDEINGVVVVYPQMDVSIYDLSIELNYQVRGQLSGLNKNLDKKVIATNESWQNGGEYPYKFKMKLPPSNNGYVQMGSYKGDNVSFFFNLKASVDFDKETDSIIRSQAIKKFKLAQSFYPEKGTAVNKEVLISTRQNSFRLVHTETTLNSFNQSLGKWWFFTLPFLSVFMSVFMSSVWPFAIITSLVVGYVLLLALFLKSNIGKVTAYIYESNEQYFSVKYDFEKSLNAVQKMKTYLTITERVIDRRGTSTSTSTKDIYTSNMQAIDDWDSSIEVTYDFPIKNYPYPIKLGDVSILWQTVLEIEVRFFSKIKIKIPLDFIEKTEVVEQIDGDI